MDEEATEALCTYLKQQRFLQQKLTDLESWSRRNNLRIFGVAEGEEGNSVPQFIEKLIKSEPPASQTWICKYSELTRFWQPDCILMHPRDPLLSTSWSSPPRS